MSEKEIKELERKIEELEAQNEKLEKQNVTQFIEKLKSENLCTPELEEFIDNYMRFYV